MDLKQYFKKVRDMEASIGEPYPLVISLETGDGGKPGVTTEVSRAQAATLIVECRGVLANEEQKQAHFAQQAEIKKLAEKADFARRVQIAIVSEPEVRNPGKQQKTQDVPQSQR